MRTLKCILQNMSKNDLNYVYIIHFDLSCSKWKVLMRGPAGTPYELGEPSLPNVCLIVKTNAGAFVLGLEFPERYPYVPPEVKFVTPVSLFMSIS